MTSVGVLGISCAMTRDELAVAAYTAERSAVVGTLNSTSPCPGYSRIDGEDGVGYILPNSFFTWQPNFNPRVPIRLTLFQHEGQTYALTQHIISTQCEMVVSLVMRDVPPPVKPAVYVSIWERLRD